MLGGGLVAGSVVLVGGEPGVGKSTLLLQALLGMEAAGVSTLLVSGEESAAQVKLRSVRLGGGESGLRLITETQSEQVAAALEQLQPAACVVDSVQTLWSAAIGSTPGLGGSDPRGDRPASAGGQGQRHRPHPGRSRHQGRRTGRPPGARAHGRRRALVRGGPRPAVPHPPRRQEPLRLHQRGGGVPDGRAGAGRGPRPVLGLPGGRRPSLRFRGGPGLGGHAAACWPRCRPWSRPATWPCLSVSPGAWTATGLP